MKLDIYINSYLVNSMTQTASSPKNYELHFAKLPNGEYTFSIIVLSTTSGREITRTMTSFKMACHVAASRVQESQDDESSQGMPGPPAGSSAEKRCARAGLRARQLGPARIFDAFTFHSEARVRPS